MRTTPGMDEVHARVERKMEKEIWEHLMEEEAFE